MGIYIKDMKMPKSCAVCPFCNYYGACVLFSYGIPARYNMNPHKERPSWCELKELPLHGRLIDADVLANEIENETLGGYWGDSWRTLREIIADAPTILKAEEEECPYEQS